MGYGGFEMGFFWYAGYEFQKVGEKSGMRDWAPPPPLPPIIRQICVVRWDKNDWLNCGTLADVILFI